MEQAVINRDGSVSHGTDKGLFVEFSMHALEDEEASKAHGRPIYRDVEFIKIIPLGDTKTIVHRPVRFAQEGNVPADTDRWPDKYRAFKNQQIQVEEGTPIEEWPPLTKAQAMMLKGINIHTVEALSQVGDHNLTGIGMGARALRDKALAFIEEAEKGGGLLRLQDENADLKLQMQAMKSQLDGFAEMLRKNSKPVDQEANDAPVAFVQPEPEPTLTVEPINFTPANSTYGKRGRPPKPKQGDTNA